MGFIEKFKGFMGLPDDEYDEEDLEYEETDDVNSDYDEYHDYETGGQASSGLRYVSSSNDIGSFGHSSHDNKVVNIHATTQLQVVLVKPERFEDASSVADHLNAKRTVVLNLESTSRDISRRLVDFLSGVAYANGGQIKKVANATFIITPYNVGVTGDSLLDELESNGVYF